MGSRDLRFRVTLKPKPCRFIYIYMYMYMYMYIYAWITWPQVKDEMGLILRTFGAVPALKGFQRECSVGANGQGGCRDPCWGLNRPKP